MPIIKNTGTRVKSLTWRFFGIYVREDEANSFTEIGIIQDIWSEVPVPPGRNSFNLELRYGGIESKAGKITISEDGAGYTVNCTPKTSNAAEYTAEEWRDNVLVAFNNTTWSDPSDVDVVVTQKGSFVSGTETIDGDLHQTIVWTPLVANKERFLYDYPTIRNGEIDHYINVADLSLAYNTNFWPTIGATYHKSNDQVVLTFNDQSEVHTNGYWDFGKVHGTSEGESSPLWAARVISNLEVTTSFGDTNTIVVLQVIYGSSYLENISFQNNGSIGELHRPVDGRIVFLIKESLTQLVLVDHLDAGEANAGYHFSGHTTGEDLLGDIQSAIVVVGRPQEGFTITFGNYAAGPYNRTEVVGFVGGVLVPSNLDVTELHFTNNFDLSPNTTEVYGSSIYRLKADNVGSGASVAGNVQDWVDLINNAEDLALEAIMLSDSEITLYPLEALDVNIDVSELGFGEYNLFFGTIVSQLRQVAGNFSETISLADDPNREEIGNGLGVRFFGTTKRGVNSTSTEGQLPMFTFSRGSGLLLDNGFIVNVSDGYDWHGDAKDGYVTIRDNSRLIFDGEHRDDLWGRKRTWTGNIAGATFIGNQRTPENPFTVSQTNGGSVIQGEVRVEHVCQQLRRNRFFGDKEAQTGFPGLVWNTDNGLIPEFSSRFGNDTSFFPVLGENKDRTITIDHDDGGSAVYQIGPGVKNFDGEKIIHNRGTFNFSDNGSLVITDLGEDYNSDMFVGMNFDLSGAAVTGAGGYRPRGVKMVFGDLVVNGAPHAGDWQWNSAAGNGGWVRLFRNYNPYFVYNNTSLNGVYESYYDGTGSNEPTLTPIKEAVEKGTTIGTVGEQQHPWVSGVEVDQGMGLADVFLNGVSSYESADGWGSDLNPTNGVGLSFLVGQPGTNDNQPDLEQWFVYNRRDGFRPEIKTLSFGSSLLSYESTQDLVSRLDPSWETNLVSEIDTYVANMSNDLLAPPSYSNANNTLSAGVSGADVTWNDWYRFVDHCENAGIISGASLTEETRDYDADTNGRFRRFINRDNPVTSGTEINISEYNLRIFFEGNVSRSSTDNGIQGIDVGENTIEFIGVDPDKTIYGNFRARSVSFNTDVEALRFIDSEFEFTDAQVMPAKVTLTAVKILTNKSLTLEENTNSIEVLSRSNVTTTTVVISGDSTNGRYGLLSSRLDKVEFDSSMTSTNDAVYASTRVSLPDTTVGGVFDCQVAIVGVSTNAQLTCNYLNLAGTYSGSTSIAVIRNQANIKILED